MKKRTNKILALLLATTVCSTAFIGCGQETKTSEVTSTETVGTGTEVASTEVTETVPAELKNVDVYPLDSDKTFKITVSSDLFGTEDGQTAVTRAMEKGTGVSVDWNYMAKEAFQLALTGKEIPDALFLYNGGMDKATAYEYGDAGYFVNFMDYLELMPNFSAVIEEHPEWLEVVQNEDGSVYCLPYVGITSTAYNNLIFYRTDMMKEIGWEKAPATTDEFVQYIKELQAHFGATDPEFIAFNGYQASHMEWDNIRFPNYFFASFGELVQTTLTVDSSDKVVLGAATEQYKHYLEFMNEMWNSGAFNTNIYTQEGTASQALAAGGHVGIASVHSGHTLANFPSGNFDLGIMAPLTSEYWDTQHWYQAPACKWGRLTMISTKCEDVETMVQWMDAWYSTVENPLNAEGTIYGITPWLGEIGVDYKLDEATLEMVELPHDGIEMGKFLSTQSFGVNLYSGYEDGLFPYSQDINTNLGAKGHGTVNNLWPYAETPVNLSVLTLTQDESDIYNDAWADIDTYIGESTAKFITGEWSIEQSWDSYVAELDKMGLKDVIGVYQAAYDRTKK
ncbi:MAG: hypothetical protein IKJ16_02910 [Agathobacter sp.]|nr:hypothetical protein [Agathobacter sp.]